MANLPLLSQHTYIKVGGPADSLVIAKSQAELVQSVTSCRENNQRFFILGSGSNTLFTDEGFRGTVIVNQSHDFHFQNNLLIADSGCPMNLLVNQAVTNSLSGLEWYLGLPGTLGGAIYNNSHFKSHLVAELVESVTVLTLDNQQVTLPADQLDFDYDHSRFQHSNEIILTAVLRLTPGDKSQIEAAAQESLKVRSTSQPLSFPSSGCFFKNPQDGTSAGALIDQAGLKNISIGGATVSPVHANFIVNNGMATASDIHKLSHKIQQTVFEKFGIKLEPEVFFIDQSGERITS